MFTAHQIKHDMKVVDTADQPVGTVDHVDEDGIGLQRQGFTDGLHHFVPLAAVMRIDGDTIVIEPGQATSIEAVEGAILYARRRASLDGQLSSALFGTSGHGTGSGGSGF
jgi:hypothetical protein